MTATEDTRSIQTMIQSDPMVRVSVGYRESSGALCSGMWYWEAWCFSDDPRLASFQSPSIAYSRRRAQTIHDGIVKSVRRFLRTTEVMR